MKKKFSFIFIGLFILAQSACNRKMATNDIKIITLDPGHFHAALIQKSMYANIQPLVHVYAPSNAGELKSHLALIDKYNSRPASPTKWEEKVYTGSDYFEKMIQEKAGNVVVLAGNNKLKTDYISKSISAGFNVLADKPMAITQDGFQFLLEAFRVAKKKHLALYDIMTERYEVTNILQKAFMQFPEIFGSLQIGTEENPAVQNISVHHFFKNVSGSPLIRPTWYFDVEQEGEGIVDVSTHLVDLIQWQCFSNQVLDYTKDINMLSAKRWATQLTPSEFKQVTQQEAYPMFLKKDLKDSSLNVFANGEMNYTIKKVHARVTVKWNFQAPAGSADTYYSIIRGTKASIVIRQGKEEGYQPILYIEPTANTEDFQKALLQRINEIQSTYPGVSVEKYKEGWRVIIPAKYAEGGHEASFAEVVKKYMGYLQNKRIPEWEVASMIAKYYTTTSALSKATTIEANLPTANK